MRLLGCVLLLRIWLLWWLSLLYVGLVGRRHGITLWWLLRSILLLHIRLLCFWLVVRVSLISSLTSFGPPLLIPRQDIVDQASNEQQPTYTKLVPFSISNEKPNSHLQRRQPSNATHHAQPRTRSNRIALLQAPIYDTSRTIYRVAIIIAPFYINTVLEASSQRSRRAHRRQPEDNQQGIGTDYNKFVS
jgi:hypothetical protein